MVEARQVPVHYRPGGAYGICDLCGFKFRLTELRKDWRGLMVCQDDYDSKPDTMNPPRIVPENVPPREMRPEPPDTFVGTVTPNDL